jgi:hypothetical protein
MAKNSSTYESQPLVIRELFDSETYAEIINYLDNFVPLFPLDSDLREEDSPNKFGRKYAHNLPFFVDIHHQLSDYASEIFGRKVKPSYVFLSMYKDGGQCPLHIDRPQCRYTIDYLIRQDDKAPWPIHIGPEMTDSERAKISNGHPEYGEQRDSVISSVDWTSCELMPNDAVCYSGTNAWHYRPTKSKGCADLAFFHFVPSSFKGSLD